MNAHSINTSERARSRSVKPLQALVPFILRYKFRLAMALGALLIAAAAMLVLPVAVRYLIDKGLMADDPRTIDGYFLAFFAVALLFGVFAALRFYLVTWLGERIVTDLRDTVYRKVLAMDPAFFEVTQTGEVLSRLTTDTTLIQSIAGAGLSIALRSSLTLAGGLIMLAVTSPILAGLVLLLVPLVLVPLVMIGRHVRRLSRSTQDRVADSSGLAGEMLNAIQTVQAFTLEKLQGDRFTQAVEATFSTAVQRIRVRALLTAIAILTLFGAITFVLWIGAHQVLTGAITGGQLGQFMLYAMFVGAAAASLSEMWGEVQRGAGAMERIVELMHAQPAVTAPPSPVALPQPGRGSIELDAVSFSYPSRPQVRAIDALSLSIDPGETVAIVGPSGAGKSTLFQLVLRFYDPQAGRVLVDGVDIARTDPQRLRERIGLVPQDTVVFATSARENIRYGRPGADDAAVEQAARAAEADAFIRQLPDGYDTFLGERGTRLSGGQRQRIAIARAILKDPSILLLDEVTSSLDADSERLVQAALDQLMRERTTVIIAHRLATVLKARRIVVLNHGRITNIGTHQELLQRDLLYQQLAALQFLDGATAEPHAARSA